MNNNQTLLLTKTELAKHLRISERQLDRIRASLPSPLKVGAANRPVKQSKTGSEPMTQTLENTKPTDPMDVAASVAINIAKLLVGENWTEETYREQRDYVNSLPGVDIVSLPRDAEFGYVS